MQKKLFIPQISAHTTTLIETLRTVPVGATVSYEILTAAIGANVQAEARHILASARRIVRREDSMVFGVIRGEGLRRLTDSEIATAGSSFLRHVNRTARSGVQTLACVQDFNKLKLEEQIRHNTHLSLLGVFYEVSKTRGIKQIEAVVSVMQKSLPYKDTIRAFLGA